MLNTLNTTNELIFKFTIKKIHKYKNEMKYHVQ
jgi:hypothetical protein